MYGFTETLRFTSSRSPFGTGTNLQNITKKMRVMFIPDEGFVFLEMDLSQAEARIVAYRARDYDGLVKIFESGQDIHKYVASIIFKKLADLISFMERYTAKRIVHASNYDMGPKKFAEIYNMDIARFNLDIPFINKIQAAAFQRIVHKAFPNIRDVYHREIREEVSKTKTLHGIWGSRMIFHDRIGPDLFRAAYAYYAQNAIGQLTNIILMKIAKDVTVLHQMHDGLLMQVKPDEVKDVMNYIHDQAQIPITIEGRTIIIPEEYGVGDNWGEMKEVERSERDAA
jgi:DNA polymerase-1